MKLGGGRLEVSLRLFFDIYRYILGRYMPCAGGEGDVYIDILFFLMEGWEKGEATNGIYMSNCSSTSLSSSGFSSSRCAHVFFTIAAPDLDSDSLKVIM